MQALSNKIAGCFFISEIPALERTVTLWFWSGGFFYFQKQQQGVQTIEAAVREEQQRSRTQREKREPER